MQLCHNAGRLGNELLYRDREPALEIAEAGRPWSFDGDLLKRGAILIDDTDEGDQPRALLYLEHGIQDARTDRSGNRRIVSKRMQFVEIEADGQTTNAGPAPYLDYRPMTNAESRFLEDYTSPQREQGTIAAGIISASLLAPRAGMAGELEARAGMAGSRFLEDYTSPQREQGTIAAGIISASLLAPRAGMAGELESRAGMAGSRILEDYTSPQREQDTIAAGIISASLLAPRAGMAGELETRAGMAGDLEARAMEHAAIHLVPQHLDEVRHRKEELIDKTNAAVQDRLTKEINYWDHRAAQLKDQELAGKVNAKLNSGLARQRADNLTARLQKRLTELEQERKLSPLPPVVLGGALIVPRRAAPQTPGTG